MILFCLGVIGVEMCLALLSRMHFSKYKGKWRVAAPWLAMGEAIFEWWRKYFSLDYFVHTFRSVHVESRTTVETMVRERIIKQIAVTLAVLFVSCLGTIFVYCASAEQSEGAVVIQRPTYAEDTQEKKLDLMVGQEVYSYSLQVSPQELTQEEFDRRAETLFVQLETGILGDNKDAEHIDKNLCLPTVDDENIFRLRWESSQPDILSSSGVVHLEEQSIACPVELSVTVEYLDYEATHSFCLVIQREEKCEDASVNAAKEMLEHIEKGARNDAKFTLPDKIGKVKVLFEKKQNQALQCLVVGILCAGLVIPLSILKEQEEIRKQNAVLKAKYCFFVKRLWLLLGAGMTVQRALREFVDRSVYEDRLVKEIGYALHQLDAGGEEAVVYEELGRQLQIPEYRRLMLHISQYIRVGHNNLQSLMEQEMQSAFETRKELAKQKGEKASTKLLFPMILLLAIVMIIILYPALYSV